MVKRKSGCFPTPALRMCSPYQRFARDLWRCYQDKGIEVAARGSPYYNPSTKEILFQFCDVPDTSTRYGNDYGADDSREHGNLTIDESGGGALHSPGPVHQPSAPGPVQLVLSSLEAALGSPGAALSPGAATAQDEHSPDYGIDVLPDPDTIPLVNQTVDVTTEPDKEARVMQGRVIGHMSSVISNKWKNLDENTRQKYQELASLEREEYYTVMENIHNKYSLPLPPYKINDLFKSLYSWYKMRNDILDDTACSVTRALRAKCNKLQRQELRYLRMLQLRSKPTIISFGPPDQSGQQDDDILELSFTPRSPFTPKSPFPPKSPEFPHQQLFQKKGPGMRCTPPTQLAITSSISSTLSPFSSPSIRTSSPALSYSSPALSYSSAAASSPFSSPSVSFNPPPLAWKGHGMNLVQGPTLSGGMSFMSGPPSPPPTPVLCNKSPQLRPSPLTAPAGYPLTGLYPNTHPGMPGPMMSHSSLGPHGSGSLMQQIPPNMYGLPPHLLYPTYAWMNDVLPGFSTHPLFFPPPPAPPSDTCDAF